MIVQDLETFYDYNYWATKKILPVISQLTIEEFKRFFVGVNGSIRNTIIHLLSTEWDCLSRCGGHERDESLKTDVYSTVEPLPNDWKKVERKMREFLSQLEDDDLNRNTEYRGNGDKKRPMPLGELLHHSIIHGAHHRGQVAVLLRELGYAPVSFDILSIMQKNTVCRHGKY